MKASPRQFIEAVNTLKKSKLDGLKMVRLTPHQAAIAADPCSEILIKGSNRGSKTLTAAVRFASIVRDIPVKTTDGREIHCRLPHQKNRALLTWVIGDHLKHIGQTIYRVLFRPDCSEWFSIRTRDSIEHGILSCFRTIGRFRDICSSRRRR